MEVERVATHVDGLDSLIGGGIPKGHVTLVSGLPGTMKSSLAYSVLHHNARSNGTAGLYVSLEQTKSSLKRQMIGMGFNDPVADNRITIIDVAALRKEVNMGASKGWMDFLRRALQTRREVRKFDLFVLDALDALDLLGRHRQPRANLFDFFEFLRELEATSFVLSEAPPEPTLLPIKGTHRLDATYLADGLIHLKMHQVSDVAVQRRLRVVKMRGTAHETGYLALVFEEGKFRVTRALSV